ncbi:hypothetical protein ACRAWD_02385 [Caulobacter segnis]
MAHAVTDVTLAGSMDAMLNGIRAVGRDVERPGGDPHRIDPDRRYAGRRQGMNGGDTALDRARERLLGPAGLDEAMIGRALAVLAGGGADIAELYFEDYQPAQLAAGGRRVTQGGFSTRQGVGARSAHRGQVSFAHSADIREGALLDAARAVRTLESGEARSPATRTGSR